MFTINKRFVIGFISSLINVAIGHATRLVILMLENNKFNPLRIK